MPDAQSQVTIIINGKATSLEEATKAAQAALKGLGNTAGETSAKAEHLAGAENKAEKEGRKLAESAKIAAESVGLLGLESGESVGKLFLLRDAASDFTKSMGSMRGAIIGGIAAAAAFGALDFLRESVGEAMAGQKATALLNQALSRTPGLAKDVNEEIERGAATWAQYGETVGQVKALVARGAALGVDPKYIADNAAKIGDLSQVLGTDYASALNEATKGQRGALQVIDRLNLSYTEQHRLLMRLRDPNLSPTQRLQMLVGAVERSGFAGSSTALSKTAQGQFAAFNASLSDLRETVGTDVIPALTDMARTMVSVIGGTNQALQAFGGLGGFLKATWAPLLGVAVIGLTGLRGVFLSIGEYLFTRLRSIFTSTTASLADVAAEAGDAATAIREIPPTATTTAEFIAGPASALKDAYLANLNLIPGAVIPGLTNVSSVVTTPVFNAAAAETSLSAYETEVANVPRTIPVTTSMTGAEGAIAVTAVATVATVLIASGALKPVTDALGNLTGTVVKWVESASVPVVHVTGTVVKWVEHAAMPAVHVVGQISKWLDTATAPSVHVTASIAKWAESHVPTIINVTGQVTKWVENAIPIMRTTGQITKWAEQNIPVVHNMTGQINKWVESNIPVIGGLTGQIAHWSEQNIPVIKNLTGHVKHVVVDDKAPIHIDGTATVNTITVPKGEQVHIGGTATVKSIQVPKGSTVAINSTATVKSIQVPKGTTVTIHGSAVVDNVSVPKGKSVTIHGGAEVDSVTVAKGKTITIHGTGQIDNVTLKKGSTIDVSGGTATINTLQAKQVKIGAGALTSAIGGTPQNAAPFYIKYVPVGKPPATGAGGSGGSTSAGGGSNFWGDIGANILNAAIFGLVSVVIGKLAGKFSGSSIMDMIKSLFSKKPPSGPSGGTPAVDPDAALRQLLDDAQKHPAKGEVPLTGEPAPNFGQIDKDLHEIEKTLKGIPWPHSTPPRAQPAPRPAPGPTHKPAPAPKTTPAPAGAPKSTPKISDEEWAQWGNIFQAGISKVFHAVNWHALAKNVTDGFKTALAPGVVGAAIGLALLSGFKLLGSLFSPTAALAAGGPELKKRSQQAQKSLFDVGVDAVKAILNGAKSVIGKIFDQILQGIRSHLPGPFQNLIPAPPGKKGTPTSSPTSSLASYGLLASGSLGASLSNAQVAALTASSSGRGVAGAGGIHIHGNVTLNLPNVHGSEDVASAIAQELSEFVGGMRAGVGGK